MIPQIELLVKKFEEMTAEVRVAGGNVYYNPCFLDEIVQEEITKPVSLEGTNLEASIRRR